MARARAPAPQVVSISEERAARAAAAGNGSVAHAWHVYLATAPDLRGTSERTYKCCVARAIRELGDDAIPTRMELQSFINRIHTKEKLSESYANQHYRVLLQVTEVAAYTEDPALMQLASRVRQIKPLREPELPVRCPPFDALERSMPAARNIAEGLFLVLCCEYLLRVNEVRGLKPQDYNPRTGRLMVMRSDPDATTRKNRFLHNVELRPLHRRVMSEVIHRRADFRPRQGNHKGKSAGQIFQWSENYVAGFMKRIREHLGDDRDVYFPPRTAFHAYRHLGATAIAETPKKNMFDVQRALGDKSAAQAMKYCGNVGVGSVSSGVDMGDRVFHNALEDFGTPPLPEGGDASGEGGSQQLFALLTHRTKGPTGPESQ